MGSVRPIQLKRPMSMFRFFKLKCQVK